MNIGTFFVTSPYQPIHTSLSLVKATWDGEDSAVNQAKSADAGSSGASRPRGTYTAVLINPETSSAIIAATSEASGAQTSQPEAAEQDVTEDGIEQTPEEKFLALMNMTPEERYLELWLNDRGMTTEGLNDLPREEREKILEEFRKELRDNTEEMARSGKIVEENKSIETETGTSESHRQSFEEIAAGYDVTNMSPREIDQLAKDLRENNAASLRDVMMLMAHGEEFLSHTPGNIYTEERLTRKMDLLAHVEEESRTTTGPKDAWYEQIDFLKRLQSAA